MQWLSHYQLLLLFGLWTLNVVAWSGIIFWLAPKLHILLGGEKVLKGGLGDNLVRRLTEAELKLERMGPRLGRVEATSRASVQKVGFLRFNPFSNTGGDNSFVLALLDEENDGVLISSLYTREGVRVYGKSVARGVSRHPLSEEEKKVLEETINKSNQEVGIRK